ncbi:uncharacterized protein [Halyomorpha halys]|uniref:uncharacterized protein n=1 Tax=Halyomorpha halys TaxID=286706 RepID=UPI0006D52750|nr:uncharacterized protein LOC106678259 [Halyomorpha halys]
MFIIFYLLAFMYGVAGERLLTPQYSDYQLMQKYYPGLDNTWSEGKSGHLIDEKSSGIMLFKEQPLKPKTTRPPSLSVMALQKKVFVNEGYKDRVYVDSAQFDSVDKISSNIMFHKGNSQNSRTIQSPPETPSYGELSRIALRNNLMKLSDEAPKDRMYIDSAEFHNVNKISSNIMFHKRNPTTSKTTKSPPDVPPYGGHSRIALRNNLMKLSYKTPKDSVYIDSAEFDNVDKISSNIMFHKRNSQNSRTIQSPPETPSNSGLLRIARNNLMKLSDETHKDNVYIDSARFDMVEDKILLKPKLPTHKTTPKTHGTTSTGKPLTYIIPGSSKAKPSVTGVQNTVLKLTINAPRDIENIESARSEPFIDNMLFKERSFQLDRSNNNNNALEDNSYGKISNNAVPNNIVMLNNKVPEGIRKIDSAVPGTDVMDKISNVMIYKGKPGHSTTTTTTKSPRRSTQYAALSKMALGNNLMKLVNKDNENKGAHNSDNRNEEMLFKGHLSFLSDSKKLPTTTTTTIKPYP